MNKIRGHFYRMVGTALDYFFQFFIVLFTLISEIFREIQRFLVVFLFAGGCLIFFLFLNPLILYWTKMWPLTFLLLVFLVPLAGTIVTSYLKYLQYIVTEYFYERADRDLLGEVSYDSQGNYGFRMERKIAAEEKRREEERRRLAEEAFRRQFESFFWEQAQGSRQYQQQWTGGGSAQSHYADSFDREYEAALEVLDLPKDADKYQVKLAYRKLAKRYHPDLNPNEDTTATFQNINRAYEFLSDENIERYRRNHS
ncbi:MAG: DnaJ domain-containing protein [Tissierellia bacterium]|nr:DnaJ domain-containing protein [Tissierellia bacterium]